MKILKLTGLVFTLIAVSLPGMSLAQARKLRFPIGLYTSEDSDIYGISFGVGSNTYTGATDVKVRSNGIRIEPISQALLVFTLIFPVDQVPFPIMEQDYETFDKKVPNEIINGINLSCGTNAFANVNGITISALAQSLKNVNGISVAGISTESFRNNGVQLAFFDSVSFYSNGILVGGFQTGVYKGSGIHAAFWYNEFKYFNGLMISMINGVFCEPDEFKGVQIGVVNRTKKLWGVQIGLWNVNEKRTLPFINWNFSNKPPKNKKKKNIWINQSAKGSITKPTLL